MTESGVVQERVRPFSNTVTGGWKGRLARVVRLLGDLQLLTIERDLRAVMPSWRGDVLDVGCGSSPFKHLLNPDVTNYTGVDIADADEKFSYKNSFSVPFDGVSLPFEDNSFDCVLCTEVLEHVYEVRSLVGEMYRVMRPGASILITVPWSARWHYIPFDYFRYTPSALNLILKDFANIQVLARGSELCVLANKAVVLQLSMLRGAWYLVAATALLLPITAVVCGVLLVGAHLSLFLGRGNSADPLGFTVIAKKGNESGSVEIREQRGDPTKLRQKL